MGSGSFSSAPLDLELKSNEIHIWCAGLEQPLSRLQQFFELLNEDERLRAERFHFEPDRRRFVSRRGMLRTILGRYLKTDSRELEFHHGSHGKPALACTAQKVPIHFNLSHSRCFALFGFTREHPIGVDIEHVHDIPEMENIAERFFSVKEHEAFLSLPRELKIRAFFHSWTCKEAFVKATGEGLSRPFDRFHVSVDPGEPARLLGIEGDSREASRWMIRDFSPVPGYVCAFAVESHRLEARRWRWEAT